MRLQILQQLNAAANYTVKERELNGRTHWVVPVVALIEGVHNGSLGPLYYPPEEIGRAVQAWNGVPLPVTHPKDGGEPVSAQTPELIEKFSVGQFFNVRFDKKKAKLKGELWVDVEKARKVSSSILTMLRAGEPLEVSTGMFMDVDPTPGSWGGEEYVGIARGFGPDHLALLPTDRGACSYEDGCGVRVNALIEARGPEFFGTESTPWPRFAGTVFQAYRDAFFQEFGPSEHVPNSAADATLDMKIWVARRTLLGAAEAEDDRGLLLYAVVNPQTGRLNRDALESIISGPASLAQIPKAAKESAQKMALDLLLAHFNKTEETAGSSPPDSPAVEPARGGYKPPPNPRVDLSSNERRSVVNRIGAMMRDWAARLGLSVQEMSHDDVRRKVAGAVEGLDTAGWKHFVREVYDKFVIYEALGDNPNEIGDLAPVSKLYKRAWSLAEETENVVLGEDAQEVREERTFVPVGNEEAADSAAAGEVITQSAANRPCKEEPMATEKKVNALIECDRTKFTEEHRDWLSTLSEEQLALLEADTPEPDPKEEETPAAEETPEAAPKGETPPEAKEAPKEEAPAENAEPEPSIDDYVANAPAAFKSTILRAVKADNQRKENLVQELLANKRNKFSAEDLRAKEIEELEALSELGGGEVDYTGKAGGPSTHENKGDNPMPNTLEIAK